jgi:hypothetical protein
MVPVRIWRHAGSISIGPGAVTNVPDVSARLACGRLDIECGKHATICGEGRLRQQAREVVRYMEACHVLSRGRRNQRPAAQ